MVFYYAAFILDAWLAAIHALTSPRRAWRSLRGAWRALPGDLMGLMVMRGCGIPAPSRIVDAGAVSAILVEHPNVGRYFGRQLISVQAQTLGRYVFCRGPIPDHMREHEMEHIRQWERLGPLYLPLYFGSSAVELLRGRRPYRDNRFEVAARRRADREMAARRNDGPPWSLPGNDALFLTSSSREESKMAMRVQVTFDCANPGKQAEFWAKALRYGPPDPSGDDDWAAIEDPDRVRPRFYFQRVPEGKVAKNRMHLDLNASGEGGVPLDEAKVRVLAEVERLKALGADDRRGAIEEDGEFWVRMNDPEGNEFCVE